ncbi:MAG: lipopolysaccharide heptosyltransferase II [bacterium]
MRIVVIRFSSLGDVILTTSLLPLLKEHYAHAEIYFCTKVHMADIVRYNPYIDGLVLLDDSGIQGLWRIIKQIQNLDADLIIDLHKNLRSFLIKNLLRHIPSITYQKSIRARRLLVKTKKGKGDLFPHVVERYLYCITPSVMKGKSPYDFPPKVYVSDEELQCADHILASHTPDHCAMNLLIAINPGARWPTKKWPVEYFAALADRLIEEKALPIALLGSAEDKETVNEILQYMRNRDKVLNICGKTSILQLAAFMRHCTLIITNDSGPMHLAVSQQVPVVAIFGPTSKEFGFYPLGKNDRVMEADISCRPCSLHGSKECKKKHFRCMRDITPQMVFEVVCSTLSLS